MIDLIDQGVGKILTALKETGELENTVIVQPDGTRRPVKRKQEQ